MLVFSAKVTILAAFRRFNGSRAGVPRTLPVKKDKGCR
jgi:hypothetical protein